MAIEVESRKIRAVAQHYKSMTPAQALNIAGMSAWQCDTSMSWNVFMRHVNKAGAELVDRAARLFLQYT